jgi:hypothetical protein
MVSESACPHLADAQGAHRTTAGRFLSDHRDPPVVATSNPRVP